MSKPGIKSTEFLITLIQQIGLFYLASKGIVPPETAAMGSAAGVVGYGLSRGLAKKG